MDTAHDLNLPSYQANLTSVLQDTSGCR